MSTVLAPEDVNFLQVIIPREIGGSHVDLSVPVDEADPSGASISLECHWISRAYVAGVHKHIDDHPDSSLEEVRICLSLGPLVDLVAEEMERG